MNFSVYCIALCAALSVSVVHCKTREQVLDVCLDAKYHKSAPGPEDQLHEQCSPWRSRSCCTAQTAASVHQETQLYTLDYNHCKSRGILSDACRRHFTQDHCFYECSPNVGPWLVQEPHRSWRNERYFGVPLCASDCNVWFEDCKDDYTCTDNWARNFDWVTLSVDDGQHPGEGLRCKNNASSCRVNVCPAGASCRTFAAVYGNASNFCQTVWDGSWRYTADNLPCMRLWFDGAAGNPNDAVAELYFNKLHGEAVSAASPVTLTPLGSSTFQAAVIVMLVVVAVPVMMRW